MAIQGLTSYYRENEERLHFLSEEGCETIHFHGNTAWSFRPKPGGGVRGNHAVLTSEQRLHGYE